MQKFSKKLVSKVIYVKILLASDPKLVELFLKEKGWELLNAWFDDAIKTLNWPLCAEMTQLFTKCPMTAQRLKENVEINLAPKLIRQLSCDQRVDATVRQNASQVLKKWMAVVATVSSSSPEPPMLGNIQPVVLLHANLAQHQPSSTSSGRTTRGSRSANTKPATNDNTPRVPVIVHTDFEEILNLDRMPTTMIKEESEGQVWVGKGGSKRAERNARRRGALPAPSRKTLPPGKSKEVVESEEDEDSDEEYKPPQDDPFDTLLSSSITNEKQKVNKTLKLIGVIRNETLDEVEPEPVKLLQGLAMELSETLKKEAVEVKKEETDSKRAVEKAKEKEARRERERQERREKEKREERRKGEEKGERKDRDKHKHSSDKERDKQREERRRKEKEREKQKEKERKEKKRESKPYRETEMRDKLDSTEKLKIKELAQKLREDSKSKKDDFQPTPSSVTLPKIPKVAKVEEKESTKASAGGKKAPGPSFEDLMFSLNSSSAQPPIKPAPIKNKSRDLIASLYEDSPVSKAAAKQRDDEKKRNENKKLSSSSLTNGDKSGSFVKQNGTSSPLPKPEEPVVKPKIEQITPEKKGVEKKEEKVEKEEEKKAIKRTSTDGGEAPKLKIKSQAQLKEGTMFGDFLSTIMPDQPKKKKIKLADLKAQKEAKAASENIVKPETEEKDDSLEKSLANAASSFSFYRDTMSETNGDKSPENDAKNDVSLSPPTQDEASVPSDSDLPSEDPESALPREVRGILVLAKGPKRSRRIQWKPQESLVEVQYFELDETERVNVNKLKFEEARKNEAIAEKAKMLQKQKVVMEDNRAWPGMQTIECELPEIDYGGNSNEKKEQEQRENKVLQILFFNNKLPNDPSEPDAAGGVRIVTKAIPLEDTSGDEAYTDYSGEPWPAPIQEKENTPVFDNILNNIQMQPELLKNLMGTALPDTENDSAAAAAALYAAQKAAEETLRKHGVEVPRRQDEIQIMEQEVPIMNPSVPPPMIAPPFEEEFPSDYPPEFPADGPPRDFYQQPPPPWQNGGPPFRGGPPHHRGGPYNRNGPPPSNEEFNRGGFRGGPRGGGPMRDFHHSNHHNGFPHNDRHHEDRGGWDRRDDRRREGGRKEYSRPCKFWMEKGYCREENRCKFPHPQGR